jgi:hypothetical protein
VKGQHVAAPKDKRTAAQLRAAELRAQAQRSERRRRLIAVVVGIVVAAALIVGFITLGAKKQPGPNTPLAFPAPVGAEVKTAVESAGLQVLGQEMLQYHIHSHLQVSDNGTDVTVPANIGIQQGVGLSPLHTHDSTGVIHVESETKGDYTLGQFFKEWNVPLMSTCIGPKCADATHELKVYVDGKPFTGDPNTITLANHEDISVAYLDKGKAFTPERFDFAGAGL